MELVLLFGSASHVVRLSLGSSSGPSGGPGGFGAMAEQHPCDLEPPKVGGRTEWGVFVFVQGVDICTALQQ